VHGLSALRQSWSVHRFIDDRRYWYRYTDPWIWDKGSLSQFRIGRKGKTQKLLLFAGYGLSSSVRLEQKLENMSHDLMMGPPCVVVHYHGSFWDVSSLILSAGK
jgi:hypothetical protein